jgi:hypothetical protein
MGPQRHSIVSMYFVRISSSQGQGRVFRPSLRLLVLGDLTSAKGEEPWWVRSRQASIPRLEKYPAAQTSAIWATEVLSISCFDALELAY